MVTLLIVTAQNSLHCEIIILLISFFFGFIIILLIMATMLTMLTYRLVCNCTFSCGVCCIFCINAFFFVSTLVRKEQHFISPFHPIGLNTKYMEMPGLDHKGDKMIYILLYIGCTYSSGG